jgi:hypothetical protein
VSDYRATDDRDPTGMSGPHRWQVKYRVIVGRQTVQRTTIIPARWRSDIHKALEAAYGEDLVGVDSYRRPFYDETRGRGRDEG